MNAIFNGQDYQTDSVRAEFMNLWVGEYLNEISELAEALNVELPTETLQKRS